VSAAWAEGILNAQEIERHPLKNVITKAVGAKDTIEIEVVERKLAPGDIVLICSDGLHAMLNDDKILEVLTPAPASLEEGVNKLIEAANQAGGKDNVSVVLLRYSK
jgi:protein phosphatase